MTIRIGVSGWTYDDWRGAFYPLDLPRRRQLEYASRLFNSIELNSSFYALQRPDSYRAWYQQSPAHFLFAVKGNRFITHNKKLTDPQTPLANFFASGVLLLKEKLGPIVWQLPAGLGFHATRLATFLELLPRDTESAARLASRHDGRMKGRSWTRTDRKRPLRYAIEVRHRSFLVPAFVRLVRARGVAIVFADSGAWPYVEEISAGYVYLRLHGSPVTYASAYDDSKLAWWAQRIRQWHAGQEPADAHRITAWSAPRRKTRDVYVYFDNDQQAHAPHDALRLAERLGVGPAAGAG
ncbi:MAG: DUF72 domain-containing protein [Candidatus Binatia bacterium]